MTLQKETSSPSRGISRPGRVFGAEALKKAKRALPSPYTRNRESVHSVTSRRPVNPERAYLSNEYSPSYYFSSPLVSFMRRISGLSPPAVGDGPNKCRVGWCGTSGGCLVDGRDEQHFADTTTRAGTIQRHHLYRRHQHHLISTIHHGRHSSFEDVQSQPF